MLSYGLVEKTVRETLWTGVLFGVGLFGFSLMISLVLPSFYEDLAGPLLRSPFFQNIVRALLGTTVGRNLGPEAMSAMGWVHPVVLCLVWAHVVVFCTRTPVGEVEGGTADLMFTLPVTRWQVYRTEAVVGLGWGLFLVGCVLGGNAVGNSGADAPPMVRVAVAAANLFAVYVAVAGVAFFASALSWRRGRAMGVVFAVVLVSFFLSFLTQFWAPAEGIACVGVLHYYRPLEVMTTGEWPWGDLALLFGVGVAFYSAGGWWLARRDL